MNEKMSKLTHVIVLLLLVVSASYGLLVVAKFIGYASFSGTAGGITELVLEFTITQSHYGGVAGVAVRIPGFSGVQLVNVVGNEIEKENLLFDCLAPDGEKEIYASQVPTISLDTSTVTAATFSDINSYLNLSNGSTISAESTYTETYTVNFDTQTINNAPGTRSFTTGLVRSNFTTILLKDAVGNLIFASILTNFSACFDSDTCNYQFVLPVFNQSNQTYYFFRDPGDECPSGNTAGNTFASLIGNVSDTSGNRLEGVIVDVAGFTTLSDATGFYNLTSISGTFKIFAIKEGFQTYHANITLTSNNVTIHNIVMAPEIVPNPLTGIGPGQDAVGDQTETGVGPGLDTGPGQDVGPGEAPLSPIIEKPTRIEGKDYVISISEIKRRIRKGSFIQEIVRFLSFKRTTAQISLELNGSVTQLIELDKESLLIDPDESDELTITIFGRGDIGVYNGSLIITGDMNGTIPIEIEVLPREKAPVEVLLMDVETSEKSYLPKSNVKFKADLRNLLTDQAYPVGLFFTIQNEKGDETIWTDESNVFLRTSFSVIKSLELPVDLQPGDYILRATASYLGLNSATSTIFKVEQPWYKRLVFGKYPVWMVILILLLLASLVGSYFYAKKKIEEKKRYHLKVDYDTMPKPGPRSIFVGKIAETDHKTYFNMEKFKVHTIVAGSTGGGKSVSAQVFIEEMLMKDVAVIVFDPTAQWTGMLRKCKDKGMLALYSFFGMKPQEARGFSGNIKEITEPREVIDVMKYAKPGEIQVFAGHRLDPKDMDLVVANAVRQFFRSNLQESKPLRLMVVFDEVHRLLPKFGGSGEGFLQIERACREFRKWGIGVMLISQVLSDFVGTIKANINTEVQMRTRDEGDLERIRQKYGEEVLRSLVKATVGSGMVENPAYNEGKPFFVAFRPLLHSTERLSDEEIADYNKYNEQIDELEYSLQQLEEGEGIDVFDLKLELKLAQDKVKTGNFNVVNVYLEGLVPRIDKAWQKLGKTPKKLEKELVSLADLKSDIETAKKEREEFEAKQEAEANASKEDEGDKIPEWGKEVQPDQILNLVNGMIVLSQQNLYDEISAMKNEDFEKHVNASKNDFADWINNAIGDPELAAHLRVAEGKQAVLDLMDLRKNEQDLPELSAEEETLLEGAEKKVEEEKVFEKMSEEPGDIEKENIVEEMLKDPDETKPAQTGAEEKTEGTKVKWDEEGKKSEEVAETKSDQVEVEEKPVAAETESVAAEEATEEKPDETEAKPAEEQKVEETTEEVKAEEVTETKPPEEQPTSIEEVDEGAGGLESLVADNPEQYFKLENGHEIKSVGELKEYLKEMPDDVFSKHVGDDYNHFADWIESTFQNSEVAGQIRSIKDKTQMSEAL